MTLLRVYANDIGLTDVETNYLNDEFEIKFIDDFLFMSEKMMDRCKINRSKLIKARKMFLEKHTCKLKKFSMISQPSYLTINNVRLNKLLDGGLPLNRVTELNGEIWSGKTLFCFNLILDFIQNDKQVFYIDTDKAMCSSMFFDLVNEQIDDHHKISELMQKIDTCFLSSYHQLVFKLNEIYQTQIAGRTNYEILIIDSLASLLTPECLVSKRKECMVLMRERISLFINLISKLLTTSITIFVTNISSSHLPRIWSNRCDLILEIKKDGNEQTEYFQMITKKSMNDIYEPVYRSNNSKPDKLTDSSDDYLFDNLSDSPETSNQSVDRIFVLSSKGSIL